MWNRVKERIKNSKNKKPKKIKYVIFRKNKDSKEIRINPNKDYWTMTFWFIGLAFIPSLVRKQYLLSLKIGLAQLFPMYIVLNGYLLKSEPILKIAEFTMLISMFIITYYSGTYHKRQIKRYRKLGYRESIYYETKNHVK